ncbi:MAG: serine hydrolase [Caulobacter sp.]|nr:serine hydrolase [Caulobacter sp.]
MGTSRRLLLSIAAALLATPALAQSPAPAPAAPAGSVDRGAEVDRIFAGFTGPNTPGCAVSAVGAGETLVERAYGVADLEHSAPITAATPFEAGSVSKQFTAAAILLLVQDGKLRLTDDIRKYLPELPDYGRPITIDQLLNHTSGLRDWGELAWWQGWPRTTRAYTQADILDLIVRQRGLNYLPGAEYSYTNSGYNLLTEIVRRVSGQSLADFTAARIFKPLGMSRTGWRVDFRAIVPGRAIAYERTPGGYRQQMPFEDGYGNGGLITTVGDLQIWAEAMQSQKLGAFLSTQIQRRASLSDGTRLTYARGLMVQTWAGVDEISHAGATAGYRAWLAWYPKQKLSVAVLCNADDAAALPMGRAVAALFLPPPAAEPPPAPLSDLASRAGLYVNESSGRPMLLVADGAGLRVAGGARLAGLTADTAASGPDRLVFQGRDAFMDETLEGNRYLFRRTPLWMPGHAALTSFLGRYYSEEIGVTWRVERDAAGLLLRLEDRPQTTIRMSPIYQDAFNLNGFLARFRRDAQGRIVAMSLGSNRVRDLRLRKIG